jgi:hypothetical protein
VDKALLVRETGVRQDQGRASKTQVHLATPTTNSNVRLAERLGAREAQRETGDSHRQNGVAWGARAERGARGRSVGREGRAWRGEAADSHGRQADELV